MQKKRRSWYRKDRSAEDTKRSLLRNVVSLRVLDSSGSCTDQRTPGHSGKGKLEVPTSTTVFWPVLKENIGPVIMQHYKDTFIDLMGGSMGGVASVYVGQPLDTVKVKMQTFPDLYRGMVGCFSQTLKRDGVRGLYAGTVPALAANIAENSVLFAAYGVCQKAVAYSTGVQKVEDLSTFSNASAGFFAAFFSSLTLCPTELVKCRLQAMREMAAMQNKEPERIGPWKLTRQILKSDGIPGLFRGLTSTFAREMPGYFFFFGGYEASRALMTPPGKTKDEIGPLKTMICGGIAGVILWTAIFPTDVVKSRIQVAGSTEPMITVTRQILRTEGVAALYNGLGPTVVRTFPATGALFLAYEGTKKVLHNLMD